MRFSLLSVFLGSDSTPGADRGIAERAFDENVSVLMVIGCGSRYVESTVLAIRDSLAARGVKFDTASPPATGFSVLSQLPILDWFADQGEGTEGQDADSPRTLTVRLAVSPSSLVDLYIAHKETSAAELIELVDGTPRMIDSRRVQNPPRRGRAPQQRHTDDPDLQTRMVFATCAPPRGLGTELSRAMGKAHFLEVASVASAPDRVHDLFVRPALKPGRVTVMSHENGLAQLGARSAILTEFEV